MAEDIAQREAVTAAGEDGGGGGEVPFPDDVGGHEVDDCEVGIAGCDEGASGAIGEAFGGDVGGAGVGEGARGDWLDGGF